MVRKLGAYGEPLVELEGRVLTKMPTVERIASIDPSGLRGSGFGYRADTIPRVAQEVLKRPDGWLDNLRLLPYEEAHRELRTLPGVGPKLADCVALYGLQKLEATPMDTHLWQAMARHYFPEWRDKALTDARYREGSTFLRNRFGAWAGFAHQYLYFENLMNWRKRARESSEDPALLPG